MARPKIFKIKQSSGEIMRLISDSGAACTKRLMALRIFKEHESTGISRYRVSEILGVDKNSVDTWRNTYIDGGIGALLSHGFKGNRRSDIAPYHQMLKAKLEEPANGIQGFVELLEWFNGKNGTDIPYSTLNAYVKRHFGASVKTGRKSHVKKDPEKVAAFKKTLSKTAGNL